MQAHIRSNPQNSGAQLFTQGRFWPISLIAMEEFEATLLVPDTLELTKHDRVTLKVGHLPSFPAAVRRASGDVAHLQFLGAIHPMLLALLETGDLLDATRVAA